MAYSAEMMSEAFIEFAHPGDVWPRPRNRINRRASSYNEKSGDQARRNNDRAAMAEQLMSTGSIKPRPLAVSEAGADGELAPRGISAANDHI